MLALGHKLRFCGRHRIGVFFQLDWLQGPIASDARLFHARYRQEYPARPWEYYTIANITGTDAI